MLYFMHINIWMNSYKTFNCDYYLKQDLKMEGFFFHFCIYPNLILGMTIIAVPLLSILNIHGICHSVMVAIQ